MATIQWSNFFNFIFFPLQFRSEHAEEMEDFIDVVNDLENKDDELAQLKAFQVVQATELIQVRKDFHELERDSKVTLEKSEYKSNKDLHAANTKVFNFWNLVSEFLHSMDFFVKLSFWNNFNCY